MNNKPRKGREVDFINEHTDHLCALYATMGFSTAFIMKETGLTACQVTYRLQKAGLTIANGTSRTDFRNGTSPFAKTFLSQATTVMDKQLIEYLKKNA